MQHVRKITSDLAWKRAVAQEMPLMRVQGIAQGGTEERSTFGSYIRWRGQFAAIVVRKPADEEMKIAPHGVQTNITSYSLILPTVGADWLKTFFDAKEYKVLDPKSNEMGVGFDPRAELEGGVRFVIDIGIGPSKGRTPEDKGYEYLLRISRADPRYNPMADLLGLAEGVEAFNPVRLTGPADDDGAIKARLAERGSYTAAEHGTAY